MTQTPYNTKIKSLFDFIETDTLQIVVESRSNEDRKNITQIKNDNSELIIEYEYTPRKGKNDAKGVFTVSKKHEAKFLKLLGEDFTYRVL